MKKIHFISGLPRSGSTLLSNILNQNPRFCATATSSCCEMIVHFRNHFFKFAGNRTVTPTQSMDKFMNVMRAIMPAYYEDIDQSVIFDKNRVWPAYIEFLETILEEKAKFLVTVRPIPDVLASFERLYRETTKTRMSPMEGENLKNFQTVKGRCEFWARGEQVVGVNMMRIEEAMKRGLRDRFHFIHFDELTGEPARVLAGIYDFLGEESFEHNFNFVEQTIYEDDDVHGFVGLHKIRNKVEPMASKAEEILGPEIVQQYKGMDQKFATEIKGR